MVSRYHWVYLNTSNFLTNGGVQPLMNLDATIPAHGILKKVLISNCTLLGHQSGNTPQQVNTFHITQLIRITSGPNNNRIIYQSKRRVPMILTSVYGTINNDWHAWHNAGDNELGADLQCSWGKATDAAAWTINASLSLVSAITGYSTGFGIAQGPYSMQVGFLYYL